MNPESGRVYRTQAELDAAVNARHEEYKNVVTGAAEVVERAGKKIRLSNRLDRQRAKVRRRLQKQSRKANR